MVHILIREGAFQTGNIVLPLYLAAPYQFRLSAACVILHVLDGYGVVRLICYVQRCLTDSERGRAIYNATYERTSLGALSLTLHM
jgi:hypothetical protein